MTILWVTCIKNEKMGEGGGGACQVVLKFPFYP